jgi:alkylhydroperoxidase/carboxymuconolactone decarboxylase family protein YurZ
MKEIYKPLKEFKKEFPGVYKGHEGLGKIIQIAISGASGHALSLETHIVKGKESGLTNNEIKHALLLLIQTTGFPTFMEAYSVFKRIG